MTDETLDAKANEIIKRIGLGKLVAGLAAVGMLTGVCAWKGVENSRGSRSAYAQTTTYQGQDDEGPNMSVAPEEPEDSYIPDMSFLPLFSDEEQPIWEKYNAENHKPEVQKPRRQRRVTKPVSPQPTPMKQGLGDCYRLSDNQLTFVFDNNYKGFNAGDHYAVEGRMITTQNLGKPVVAERRLECFMPTRMKLQKTEQIDLYQQPVMTQ